MEHELKTDPAMFLDSYCGAKTFELRYDDRGYQVGDTLRLRETRHSAAAMAAGEPLEYTGNEIRQLVTYILRGPVFGLPPKWVIMSVEPSL
jgi:hypothetical protein